MTTAETRLLHKRLEHARLARMLRRMHVSEDVYLQRLHPDTIKAQVDTCVACPHQFKTMLIAVHAVCSTAIKAAATLRRSSSSRL